MSLKSINPKFEYIAWILLFSIAIVLIYYMVIISWDLFYLVKSLTFSWGSDPALYFVHNVGGSENLEDIGNFFIPVGIGVIVSWFILWFISHRSIDKGIGLASKILIPGVFVMMAIIVVYALHFPEQVLESILYLIPIGISSGTLTYGLLHFHKSFSPLE